MYLILLRDHLILLKIMSREATQKKSHLNTTDLRSDRPPIAIARQCVFPPNFAPRSSRAIVTMAHPLCAVMPLSVAHTMQLMACFLFRDRAFTLVQKAQAIQTISLLGVHQKASDPPGGIIFSEAKAKLALHEGTIMPHVKYRGVPFWPVQQNLISSWHALGYQQECKIHV